MPTRRRAGTCGSGTGPGYDDRARTGPDREKTLRFRKKNTKEVGYRKTGYVVPKEKLLAHGNSGYIPYDFSNGIVETS